MTHTPFLLASVLLGALAIALACRHRVGPAPFGPPPHAPAGRYRADGELDRTGATVRYRTVDPDSGVRAIGLVHRDVTPTAIHLGAGARLGLFEPARPGDATREDHPAYLSPEQFLLELDDAASAGYGPDRLARGALADAAHGPGNVPC